MQVLSAGFWQQLEEWDRWLFELINSRWSHPWLDQLLPFLREELHWAPLYLFILVLVLQRAGWKAFGWVLFFLVTFALTDMSGTYLFKHNLARLRPCMDPEMADHVRNLLNRCAGHSFISNHAANHMGVAVFLILTLRPMSRAWKTAALGWAACIAYSQVYVGQHFPLDVLAGAGWGALIGGASARLFNKQWGIAIFGDETMTGS